MNPCVLLVRGFNNPLTKVKMIYNLFSNFGNIWKILLVKKKGNALIQYENI